MKRSLVFLLTFILFSMTILGQSAKKEVILRYSENYSLTYDEAIAYYKQLEAKYPNARLQEMGMTDAGRPLHIFMISSDRVFDPAAAHKKKKAIILIINGIHPGEPEGIDASAQFATDILEGKKGFDKYLKNTFIAIVPVYNIGGALNRSPYWRIDQNGPEEKGVRRNSRFLDLNRDFVKQESREARSFAGIYSYLDPDVFLDTHTTNGSDHQYTVTLIATQPEKMIPDMQGFFRNKMLPDLYENMKKRHDNEMIPYVQYIDRGEIKAIMGFDETPFFSTGYSALFNSFGFMTETLTYKPFAERVRGTYDFITELVSFTSENCREMLRLRAEANKYTLSQKEYVIKWKQDEEKWDDLVYKGYRYEEDSAPISGRKTGFYNHDKPYTDTIKYFNYFTPEITVTVPDAYIVPFAWEQVIDRLRINGAMMWQLDRDTTILAETYYIDKYLPVERSTQGHYYNTDIEVHSVSQEVKYFKGDYVVPVNQRANKYIVTMLEPQSEAGFFAWNFFDSFLEGQDWFSVWGFESHLKELLDHDQELKAAFNAARESSEELRTSPVAQLQWLYQNTPAYQLEKRVRLYPVGRVMQMQSADK